jgi:hypothetical protein
MEEVNSVISLYQFYLGCDRFVHKFESSLQYYSHRQRTEFSGKTDSIFLALMFGNLIWLLFWSYVGSIKPNLKVPIFPNLEYIFQSPEKIFLWSPLCFFLHFSKRTVEGTIY